MENKFFLENNRFLNLLNYEIHISFVPAIPQIEFILVKTILTHKELNRHIRMFLVTFFIIPRKGRKEKEVKMVGVGGRLNVHY